MVVKTQKDVGLPEVMGSLLALTNALSGVKDATKGIESHLGHLVSVTPPVSPEPFQQSIIPIRAEQDFRQNQLYVTVTNSEGKKVKCRIEAVFEGTRREPGQARLPVSVVKPDEEILAEGARLAFELPKEWRGDNKGPRFVTVHVTLDDPDVRPTRHVLPAPAPIG
jgi:hypothetical protein